MQMVSWPNTANFFTFFELPTAFSIDIGVLKIKYFEYAKLFHPDFFSLEPQHQSKAIEMSAINNKAFKILNNPISRVQYLLELKEDFLTDNSTLPQYFLMEMMELNEQIDELAFEENNEELIVQIKLNIENQQVAIFNEISENAVLENWTITTDNLLQWRYLERLSERV